MLTADDTPTIRNAIHRRLGKEPGVRICDIKFTKSEVAIRCGVVATLGMDERIVTRSMFDLPAEFEHSHLINELDEIAEQYKAARLEFFKTGGVVGEKEVSGTGLRGRWAQYGMRVA